MSCGASKLSVSPNRKELYHSPLLDDSLNDGFDALWEPTNPTGSSLAEGLSTQMSQLQQENQQLRLDLAAAQAEIKDLQNSLHSQSDSSFVTLNQTLTKQLNNFCYLYEKEQKKLQQIKDILFDT